MTLGPIMLDVEGTTLSVDDKRRLLHPLTGGVILFTRNFSSYKQLTELTAEIHALRSPSLLIATDHEGGRVQRFKEEFTCLPAMRELGKIWDASPKHAQHLAQQTGYVLAAELNACGIDLSFTPVLDIDHGQSFVIGDRAFHSDPQVIAKLAHQLMLGLKAGGLMAVGKHFPGHGYIHTDSHLERSVDERLYVDIEMDDMVPFQQMINFGMAGIMSAHVIYPKVDQNPASFSSVWLIDILRKELKFDGCIFSDDLSMLGTAHVGNVVVRTKAALDAGCDMVLVCNNPQSLDQLLAELKWDMSAVSLARLAHMHGKWSQPQPITMINLRENADYINAVKEISGIGISNRELPL